MRVGSDAEFPSPNVPKTLTRLQPHHLLASGRFDGGESIFPIREIRGERDPADFTDGTVTALQFVIQLRGAPREEAFSAAGQRSSELGWNHGIPPQGQGPMNTDGDSHKRAGGNEGHKNPPGEEEMPQLGVNGRVEHEKSASINDDVVVDDETL